MEGDAVVLPIVLVLMALTLELSREKSLIKHLLKGFLPVGQTLVLCIAFPLAILLVWSLWLVIALLPVPIRFRARWTWELRKGFWDRLAVVKFRVVKPADIPVPGQMGPWRWIRAHLLGKGVHKIDRVPLEGIFRGIPISKIQVAGHEPSDEWDRPMRVFTWFQVKLYSLFSPMQSTMPVSTTADKPMGSGWAKNVEEPVHGSKPFQGGELPAIVPDPYEALAYTYTSRHRKVFDLPVMPLEFQGSPDLGALAVKGPYHGYLKKYELGKETADDRKKWNDPDLDKRADDLYHWDFRELQPYEHYADLYNLGIHVLFLAEKDTYTVKPVRIKSELGLSTPGDRTWEFAKKLALCAATNHLSLVRHFNGVHLACAAHLARATRNCLFPNHPVCRLLWPYVFRTLQSNWAVTIAQMAKGGDFDSIFSFTHTGMCKLFETTYGQYKFLVNDPEQDAADRGIAKGTFDKPTQADLEKLFGLMEQHAKRYLHIYYPTDNVRDDPYRPDGRVQAAPVPQPTAIGRWLAELNDPQNGIPNGVGVVNASVTISSLARLLARFMFLATVQHDLAGSFLWNYQLWSHKMPTRLYRSGKPVPLDVSQRLVNANFNLNVKRTPLMQDFRYLALPGPNETAARDELKSFQDQLADLEVSWRNDPWSVWRVYPSMLEANINA